MSARLLTHHLRRRLFPRHLAQRSAAPPVLNDAIAHLRRVRLISETGEDCGEMPARAALARARGQNRDLLQVSGAGGGTPVVRVVDYAAMQAARRKSAYDARKKRKEVRMLDRREGVLKQVRLSPVIDRHDVEVKIRQAREFLREGYRVRVYMQFRRGHGRLQEEAKMALVGAVEELRQFGRVQGVEKEGEIWDLFREKETSDAEEPPEEKVKKPLEVLIYPLPRKQREVANSESDGRRGSVVEVEIALLHKEPPRGEPE